MSEKCWYYGSNEERRGPFTKQQLKELVEAGQLDLESEVYSEISDSWVKLTTVDLPEPVVREKDSDVVKEGDDTKARPWVRYFARWIDYTLFFLVVGLLTGLIGMPYVNTTPLIGFLTMFFVWCFIEAALLCTWATTPGKAILGIWVLKKDGKKLTYIEALSRALSVWLLGMGAGLPIVMVITWIVAAVKLSNNKITSWDRRGQIVVHHKKLNWLRITIAVLIFVGYGALILFYGRPR